MLDIYSASVSLLLQYIQSQYMYVQYTLRVYSYSNNDVSVDTQWHPVSYYHRENCYMIRMSVIHTQKY